MNEEILDVSPTEVATRPVAIVCECAELACTLPVQLTRAEYEWARSEPRRFVLLPSHEKPEYERVVRRADAFLVVTKHGGAGDKAKELHETDTDS